MNMRQVEQEEEALQRQLERGEITQADYNEAMRDLHRDYRDAAEESAQEAYERTLDDWGVR